MEVVDRIWGLLIIVVPIYLFVGGTDFIRDYIMKVRSEFRGFSLIDLMIIIATIGIMIGTIYPFGHADNDAMNEQPPMNPESKFESFVDDDCVAKYGEYACTYDKSK